MQSIGDLEIGVMFWARNGAAKTIAEVAAFGVNCGQLGIPADYSLPGKAEEWKKALQDEAFSLETVFASYSGEDYSSFATVLDTVGLIPQATREARIERSKQVAHFASQIGVNSFACHIGFVPEERESPAYAGIRDVVAGICDHCALHDLTFTLETGQEPAKTLLLFIEDVARPNLKVNFDPANMILYGTGAPLEALDVLGKHVVSVHCKDGDWPDLNHPELLGVETPLGQGSVDIPAFVSKLKEIGYRGPLCIERETSDAAERTADIRMAVSLLRQITAPHRSQDSSFS